MRTNVYTFMDFCAGIGGGRLGLMLNGLKPVAYSEIDKKAEQTYKLMFNPKQKEMNFGDLTKIDYQKLPDFNFMIGGFPCQTFSIVGKRQGFNDDRGMVIYGLLKILDAKNVPYFILENVKGLINHNRGQTLNTIIKEITKRGYVLHWKVLDSQYYGVPQMRERIYFVGIKKDKLKNNFFWPKHLSKPSISSFLSHEKQYLFDKNNKTFIKYLNNKYNINNYNIDNILNDDYNVLDTRQSDLRIYKHIVPTLRTGRHGILYTYKKKLYRLSGIESLQLQGFPKKIVSKLKNINNSKILSQAGNAMTVNVIKLICKNILKCIN